MQSINTHARIGDTAWNACSVATAMVNNPLLYMLQYVLCQQELCFLCINYIPTTPTPTLHIPHHTLITAL